MVGDLNTIKKDQGSPEIQVRNVPAAGRLDSERGTPAAFCELFLFCADIIPSYVVFHRVITMDT